MLLLYLTVYLVFFGKIINFTFLILISICLSSVCSNAIDCFVLILYPATLLNSLILEFLFIDSLEFFMVTIMLSTNRDSFISFSNMNVFCVIVFFHFLIFDLIYRDYLNNKKYSKHHYNLET